VSFHDRSTPVIALDDLEPNSIRTRLKALAIFLVLALALALPSRGVVALIAWSCAAIPGVAVACTASAALRHRPGRAAAGKEPGLADASGLDEVSARLLARARHGVAAILTSRIYADHLLDAAVDGAALLQYEQHLAVSFREVSELDKAAAARRDGQSGPLAADVARAQAWARDRARDHLAKSVLAIERLADTVLTADARYQDYCSATALAELDAAHHELVTRILADTETEREIAELAVLAETAADAMAPALRGRETEITPT
jgi:hypothetical protein